MSDHNFKVKFNWKLRSQSNDKTDKNDNKTSIGTSRSAKFMHDMKASQPAKFKKHLKKDATRKRKNYISIKTMAEQDQKHQREKWADSKRRQRSKKKGGEKSNRCEGKCFKDLSSD